MTRLLEPRDALIVPESAGRIIEARATITLPPTSKFWQAIAQLPPIAGGTNDFSDYLEQKLLEVAFRNVAFTAPATVYAGLYTAAPGETGGGTEVSGNGYARQSCGFGAGSQSGGLFTCTNAADIVYPANTTSNWGTIVDFGIFDASSAGNMLAFAALSASKTVNVGDVFKFLSGNLTVQLG